MLIELVKFFIAGDIGLSTKRSKVSIIVTLLRHQFYNFRDKFLQIVTELQIFVSFLYSFRLRLFNF